MKGSGKRGRKDEYGSLLFCIEGKGIGGGGTHTRGGGGKGRHTEGGETHREVGGGGGETEGMGKLTVVSH